MSIHSHHTIGPFLYKRCIISECMYWGERVIWHPLNTPHYNLSPSEVAHMILTFVLFSGTSYPSLPHSLSLARGYRYARNDNRSIVIFLPLGRYTYIVYTWSARKWIHSTNILQTMTLPSYYTSMLAFLLCTFFIDLDKDCEPKL